MLSLLAGALIAQNVGSEDVKRAFRVADGFVVGAALSYRAYSIAKYSFDGKVVWKASERPSGANEQHSEDIAVDGKGSTYFVASHPMDQKAAWFVSKRTLKGESVFQGSISAEGIGIGQVHAAGIPTGGFVAIGTDVRFSDVGGKLSRESGVLIARFDESCKCVWQRFLGAPFPKEYFAEGVAAAQDGHIYVATTTDEGRLHISAYDLVGNPEWDRDLTYRQTHCGLPLLHPVDGGLTVVFCGDIDRANVLIAARLSSVGKLLSQAEYTDAQNPTFLTGSAVAADGRIAIVGYQRHRDGMGMDMVLYDKSVVATFTRDGQIQAVGHSMPTPDDDSDGRGVAFLPSGGVYVSEWQDVPGRRGLAVRRFDAGGKQLWHKLYPVRESLGQGALCGHQLFTDATGNLILFAPVLGKGNEDSNTGFFKISPSGAILESSNVDLQLTPSPRT